MATELMPLLLRAALFASAAIVLVLLLRRPLLRWLGAALAYQAWLLVPLVVAASVLPGRPVAVLRQVEVLRPVQALAVQATTPAIPAQADMLWLLWAAGAAAVALRFVLAQRAFLRQAGAGGAGPASSGLLRPRVVLPRDFAARYSPAEQALVLAHERAHIARGDLFANLLAAVFQCVFWFDPLVHLAVRRFRQDQELACDATVMQQHPGQRRSYAEALLKSHAGAVAAAGIHCHWQHPHPTKERIMSLQHTPPGTLRRFAGRCMLVLLAAASFGATASLSARADSAAPADRYAVSWNITGPGRDTLPFKIYFLEAVEGPGDDPSRPRIVVSEGGQFSVETGEYRMDVSLRKAEAPDMVWVAGKLYRNKETVGTPTLLTQIGAHSSIRIGDGADAVTMSITVRPYP